MRRSALKPDRADRAKAAGAAALVHLLLGAALLTGLALRIDRKPTTSLITVDVEPPPPPPEPIVEQQRVAKREAPAPAGKKARASPIVAPPPRLPVPPPVAAAPIAGQGAATKSGAAASGNGTGAGGTGNGTGAGGGGAGTGGPVIGARLLSGALTRRDYRSITDIGPSRGEAELLLVVNKVGRIDQCRALRTSGNPRIDDTLCRIMQDRAYFAPAHGSDGTLYYQDVHYFPRWGR